MASPSRVTIKEINGPVQILIADDHSVIRTMLRSTLALYPRFKVCGEAQNGAEAIAEAQRLKPDVVVLDVSMPVFDGFAAAREIKASLPEIVIVILSSHTDQRFVDEARKIGARAYVAKTKLGDALIEAIETAVLGGDFILLD